MKYLFKTVPFALLMVLLFSACSPKFSYTWKQEGYESKGFEKILIHGISETPNKGTLFEVTMTKALKENGIIAVASNVTYGESMASEDQETKLQKLLDDGIDAVMTVALVDKNTETVYNQGATYTVPAYGRTYRGYSYRTYGTVQEPGYYSQETTYLLEINLYELTENGDDDGDALIWSVQSEESQPSNPKKFSQKYCERIVKQLKEDGIL